LVAKRPKLLFWVESLHKGDGPTEKERKSLVFRRSMYVVQEMQAGDEFTADNVRAIRPGLGLPTKYLGVFLGKVTSRPIKKGTPLGWELLG